MFRRLFNKCRLFPVVFLQEVNQAYEVVKEVDCLDASKEGSDAWESAVKR